MWQRQGKFFDGIDGRAQCPVVDIDNDGFWRIYFSHRDSNNHSYTSYIDVEAGNPENILRNSEAPVLSPGPLGSVDQAGAMATSIITSNTAKYLYYIGWSQRLDVPYFNTTCMSASSIEGNNWYKVGPILSPDRIDDGYSGTFYPVVNHSKTRWTGIYLSCFEWVKIDGRIEPRYNLKRAESQDGTNWTKTGDTVIDIQSSQGGASQMTVWYNPMRGIYQGWYSMRNNRKYRDNHEYAYRIRYAESFDLINWEEYTMSMENCLYATGNTNDWDGIMCCYPCVIEYNKTLYMFYNGNGFGQTGIGYATWEL